jgi:hypothetical protein
VLVVSRDRLVSETLNEIPSATSEDLRKPLVVSFRDEQGVDEGRLSREFSALLWTELASANHALLTELEAGRYWLHPNSWEEPH